jgi:protein involved in polysaccharide export with SLBB domain
MQFTKARSSWCRWGVRSFHAGCTCAIAGLLLVAGCRTSQADVDRALMSNRGIAARAAVANRYAVSCPDVLELTIASHPEYSGPHPVGVDGRLDLEPAGRPRVEGETVVEIAAQVAELLKVPPVNVRARVSEYHGPCLFLFGEVTGLQRAVPYEGLETVVECLQRTGGIKVGAAPRECYVVRTHVGDACRPEIFQVDLEAIVVRHDERTNVRLQPFDQIHVSGTREAGLEKCVPPWLRPLYARLCGWVADP